MKEVMVLTLKIQKQETIFSTTIGKNILSPKININYVWLTQIF